jgi:hypothetical protein
MGTPHYFASEEAEKAAKWDMLQNLKKLRSHLAVLRDRAENIGKTLETFGTVLANPAWKFTVSEKEISGTATLIANARPFIIPRVYLDGEAIVSLIQEIEETEKRAVAQSRVLAEVES